MNGQFFQWIDLKIETDFTDSAAARVYLDVKVYPELLRLRGPVQSAFQPGGTHLRPLYRLR